MIGAILGLAIGITAGVLVNVNIPQEYFLYSAVIILVLFDAAVGALKEMFEKKFRLSLLISGIVFNGAMVAFLAFIGKIIGLELIFAAIVLLGARILKNFSLFRRFLLNKCEKKVTIEEEGLQED